MISSAPSFVAIKDADLVYGKRDSVRALQNLNLDVKHGEFAAVVGPSGCGKSSLMKLVTGLLPPTEGVVEIEGREIDGPLTIAGMAFQNPTLLPWRKVLSNVVLPFEIVDKHRYKIRTQRARYEERARTLLGSVGLAGVENRYPWQLSGGMQQRVSLCRALVHQPELLMLDEPFGALDAFTREELWDVLQSLWMARKFTTVLVTHDLREAVYLADTVHVMSSRPGRIIATHPVPLGRPRRPETVFDPEFQRLVQSLREQIRIESRAAGLTSDTQALS